jgi:hypothetical protein
MNAVDWIMLGVVGSFIIGIGVTIMLKLMEAQFVK